MTEHHSNDFTHALFPPTTAININHLGLSSKSCFDRQSKLVKVLAKRNAFVNVCELHASAARSQDAFFNHFSTHDTLYNLAEGAPGQCMMIDKIFSKTLCGDENNAAREKCIKDHHEVFILGIAHAFWWIQDNVCKVNLHIYLDSHDPGRRREQLRNITAQVTRFKQRTPGVRFVIVASGDRNFVVKPEQHASSAQTPWHPGADVLDAWLGFLGAVGVGLDFELEEPTFHRFSRHADGTAGWTLRTLDFATAGFDPVAFAGWQCVSSICSVTSRRASDHKPMEIRFRQRQKPTARRKYERKK
jgi:hypothetical protein